MAKEPSAAALAKMRHYVEKYRAKADPKDPQQNPVFAAMVQTMDEAVGRITKAIDIDPGTR